MVAFHLCFDMGKRLVNRYIGLDYRRPKEWMLYFRVWEATVDLALMRGLPAIWSGQLAYTTKLELGHKLVPLNNYCRHRNIVLHYLSRLLGQRVNWASLDEGLAHFLKALLMKHTAKYRFAWQNPDSIARIKLFLLARSPLIQMKFDSPVTYRFRYAHFSGPAAAQRKPDIRRAQAVERASLARPW